MLSSAGLGSTMPKKLVYSGFIEGFTYIFYMYTKKFKKIVGLTVQAGYKTQFVTHTCIIT